MCVEDDRGRLDVFGAQWAAYPTQEGRDGDRLPRLVGVDGKFRQDPQFVVDTGNLGSDDDTSESQRKDRSTRSRQNEGCGGGKQKKNADDRKSTDDTNPRLRHLAFVVYSPVSSLAGKNLFGRSKRAQDLDACTTLSVVSRRLKHHHTTCVGVVELSWPRQSIGSRERSVRMP